MYMSGELAITVAWFSVMQSDVVIWVPAVQQSPLLLIFVHCACISTWIYFLTLKEWLHRSIARAHEYHIFGIFVLHLDAMKSSYVKMSSLGFWVLFVCLFFCIGNSFTRFKVVETDG